MHQNHIHHTNQSNSGIDRLEALNRYGILDTARENKYNELVRIAAQICHCPFAMITLVDEKRQWFKATHGISIEETPLEWSICLHSILTPDQNTIIPDLRQDVRFHNNPFVTGEPHLVFYAAAPLKNADGHVLGTICVMDQIRRLLTSSQLKSLKSLAIQVLSNFELGLASKEMEQIRVHLDHIHTDHDKWKKHLIHDLKTPIANILMLSKSFASNYTGKIEEQAFDYISLIEQSAQDLLKMMNIPQRENNLLAS